MIVARVQDHNRAVPVQPDSSLALDGVLPVAHPFARPVRGVRTVVKVPLVVQLQRVSISDLEKRLA